jgi:hypothetical protein
MHPLTTSLAVHNTLVRSAFLKRFDRLPGFLTPADLTPRTALFRHSPSSLMKLQLS